MLNKLTPEIKAVILDMDGVLWQDNQALVDLPAVFHQFYNIGVKVILATNNATRSPLKYQQKIANFGVNIELDQILTSSMATAELMRRQFPNGGPVFIAGEDGLRQALESNGFFHAEENVLAVVSSQFRQLTFDSLKHATLLLRTGVPYFHTNPDPSFPTPEGLIPGSGAVLAYLETASGRKAEIAGKPSPHLFLLALQRLHLSPLETIAIGDRLDTDILGGQRAGCRTGLVLSGVTTPEEVKTWEPAPDLIAKDLAEMVGL
jgi:4-nitrophenyl phosphatase